MNTKTFFYRDVHFWRKNDLLGINCRLPEPFDLFQNLDAIKTKKNGKLCFRPVNTAISRSMRKSFTILRTKPKRYPTVTKFFINHISQISPADFHFFHYLNQLFTQNLESASQRSKFSIKLNKRAYVKLKMCQSVLI